MNRKQENKGRDDTNNNKVAEQNAAYEMMMTSIHMKEEEELSGSPVQQDEVDVQSKEVKTGGKDKNLGKTSTTPSKRTPSNSRNLLKTPQSHNQYLQKGTTSDCGWNDDECMKMNSHGNENEQESKVVETVE